MIEDNIDYLSYKNIEINHKFALSLFYELSLKRLYDLFLIEILKPNNSESSFILDESINLCSDKKIPSMLKDVYSYFYDDHFYGNNLIE